MAWNKLPKSPRPVAKLDKFDLEAEAEGNALRRRPLVGGPVGKRIAKIRDNHERGGAIISNRAMRHIDISQE